MKEPVKGSEDDGLFVTIPADMPDMTLADALEMLVEEFGWEDLFNCLAALAYGQRHQRNQRYRNASGETVNLLWELITFHWIQTGLQGQDNSTPVQKGDG